MWICLEEEVLCLVLGAGDLLETVLLHLELLAGDGGPRPRSGPLGAEVGRIVIVAESRLPSAFSQGLLLSPA